MKSVAKTVAWSTGWKLSQEHQTSAGNASVQVRLNDPERRGVPVARFPPPGRQSGISLERHAGGAALTLFTGLGCREAGLEYQQVTSGDTLLGAAIAGSIKAMKPARRGRSCLNFPAVINVSSWETPPGSDRLCEGIRQYVAQPAVGIFRFQLAVDAWHR